MVLEHSYGRTVIPLGAPTRRANVPGHPFTLPVQYGAGMPGSSVGQ
jgi:hypothetical protein